MAVYTLDIRSDGGSPQDANTRWIWSTFRCNSTPRSYGMGWWGREELPDTFYDSGAYGSVAWIDTSRMIGGFVAVEDYARTGGAWWQSINFVLDEIIPLVGEIVDEARLAVEE